MTLSKNHKTNVSTTLNQNGFGAIGIIVVLFAVVALTGVGYSVYHSKQNSNSSATNSTQASSTSSTDKQSSHLYVKEWGTSFNYSAELGTLGYVYKSSGDSISFSSSLEDSLPASCPKGSWGLTRIASGKYTDMDGKTISDADAIKSGSITKIGDYLYEFDYPQIACSDNAKDKATEVKVDANYRKVLGL